MSIRLHKEIICDSCSHDMGFFHASEWSHKDIREHNKKAGGSFIEGKDYCNRCTKEKAEEPV